MISEEGGAMRIVKIEVLAPVGDEYLCRIDTDRIDGNTVVAFEKDGEEYLLEGTGDGKTFLSKKDLLKITVKEIFSDGKHLNCYVKIHKPKKVPLFQIW